MGWIWIILFLIILIAACYTVYREAEIHELYKMRASFEMRKHSIEDQIVKRKDNKEYKGELEGIKDAIEIVDKELEEVKLI